MIYFLNSSFNEKNSGIEHAEIGRSNLFRQFGQPFQILLRTWNPLLHQIMPTFGFSDDEFINLFDFYQDTRHVTPQKLTARDIDFGFDQLTYAPEVDKHRIIVTRHGQIIGRINLFTACADEQVRSVELFDAFGNLYKVDFYDVRGFLSLSQWYSPDNKVENECWHHISGAPAIETFNRKNAAGEFVKSGWLLHEANGVIRSFSNLDYLFDEFLNDVNERNFDTARPNIFVMDRTEAGDWALPSMRMPAYTVMHLHNAHVGDPQKPATSILNNHYEYAMHNANAYDAIIAATDFQSRDVQARFALKSPIFTIPVGIVPNTTLKEARVPMADRRANSILVTARIAPEKQLDHLVRAVGIAKKRVPDVTLDLYGYVDHSNDDQALKRIRAAIAEFQLEDNVHIHDYAQDLRQVQQQAQVYGLTSVMEGFNLALMEAMSRGTVGLTYDVNYGPNELVEDGVNGYVVPYGDVAAMAERLVRVLTDDAKLQALSDGAYELSARFAPTAVWQQWQALIADAAQSWPQKVACFREPVSMGL